tara:strand:+ start:66 stop:605 length:540 start_codon:yes stop_codon:yes gene_type:complete
MAEVGCLKDGHFQNLQVESRTSLSGGHLNTVVLNGDAYGVGTTKVLTAANSGATCVFDTFDSASKFILPAPELGMRFTFISGCAETPTAGHVIQAATNSEGFIGGVISVSTTVNKAAVFVAAGAGTDDFINFDGGTAGGAPGTRIEVVALLDTSGAKCWGVSGQVVCVGASTAQVFAAS